MYYSQSTTEIPNTSAEQAAKFLGAITKPDDLLLVRLTEVWTEPTGRKSEVHESKHVTAGGLSTAGTFHHFADNAALGNSNVFFGVCPRPRAPRKATDDGRQIVYGYDHACQVRTVRCLWTDIDDAGPEGALLRCEDAGLPRPTVTVATGRGAHLYWTLAEPVEIADAYAGGLRRVWRPEQKQTEYYDEAGDRVHPRSLVSPTAERLQAIVHAVAGMVGGDSTQDLARLLRLPGTLNRKDARNGQQPAPCRLWECDPDRQYELDEFPEPAAPTRTSVSVPVALDRPAKPLDLTREPKWVRERWQELLAAAEAAEPGTRSEADQRLVTFAVQRRLDPADVYAAVQHAGKFGDRGEDYFRTCWGNAAKWTARQEAEREAWASKYDPPEELAEPTPDVPPDAPAVDPGELVLPDELRPEKRQPAGSRRTGVRDADLDGLPDPEPLVDGIIDVETCTCLYGDSNVGKSFVAIDLANSIARGVPFLDHFRVFQTLPTCYIYSEGSRGLKKRVQAWRQVRGHGPCDQIAYLPYTYCLNDPDGDELDEVLAEAEQALGTPAKVLIVDTFAKNFVGDENSPKDMGDMVRRLSELVTLRGMTVVVVHHTGKDPSRGARGSSALRGGIDNECEVTVGPVADTIALHATKARDHAKVGAVVCGRREVTLGTDREGRPLTSLVYSYSHMADEQLAAGQGETAADRDATALANAIKAVLSETETTASAIATAVGADGRKVRRVLEHLRDGHEIGAREVLEKNGVKGWRYRTRHKPDRA